MKKTIINLLVVFGTLFVFGIVKVPYEIKMENEMREKNLLPPKIDLSDRNSVGQAGYAAALGGFRDVLASYNFLKAYNQHAERDWYEMERTLNTVVTLQPRSEFYWEMAGWQLAYNTFSLTRDNQKLTPVEREKLSKEYITRGDNFLKRGLKLIPDSYAIASERMRLFTDTFRMPDYKEGLKTVEQLMEMGEMNSNQVLLAWGHYVYILAAIPGSEYETYLELKKLMSVSTLFQRVPTQRVLMYILQNQLMIPLSERISDKELLFNAKTLQELLELYNYERKIANTDEATLRNMLKSLQDAWQHMEPTDKSDLIRAKIFALQNYLNIENEQIIDDESLFISAENRGYVIGSLQYRSIVDSAKGSATSLHQTLVKKFLNGLANRNETEIIALLQIVYRDEIPAADFIAFGKLLYRKFFKYKELKNYWEARNSLYEKMKVGDVAGIQVLPVGNIVEEIRQLEEELNIPEEERITPDKVFTSRAY